MDATEGARVIVRLDDYPTDARLAGLRRHVGRFPVGQRLGIVNGFGASLTKGQIVALSRLPEVRSIEQDADVHAVNDSAQTSFGVTQARIDAGVDGDGDGNAAAYSAADLVAAVIDTGIDTGHLDLDDGKVLAWRDFVGTASQPYDDNGHGTHVAATIAGDGEARADRRYGGVAPGAALIGLKVLDSEGDGVMSDVVAALQWVVDNRTTYGIEVVNLSLGTTGCSSGTDAASSAVNAAQAAGLVVVVAAGNEGPGTCTIGSPGAAAGALTVGAMSDLGVGGFFLADYSSRGPTADGRLKPDVVAPGDFITSAAAGTTAGYTVASGTSMAAPFTAGVALLMRDRNPAMTAPAVKAAIVATAVDWGRGGNNQTAGSSGPDIDYGAGRLDAYAAIGAAGTPLTSSVPTPKHTLFEGAFAGRDEDANHYFDVVDLGHPIAVTLIIPGLSAGGAATPDFDIRLFDPTGERVAASLAQLREEWLSFMPSRTGTYRLRVNSYRGAGGYFADVSFGGPSPSPSPSASPSPSPSPSASPSASPSPSPSASPSPSPSASPSPSPSASPSPSPGPSNLSASPTDVTLLAGTVRAGSAANLAAADDQFLAINSSVSTRRIASWYGSFDDVAGDLTGLTVTYEGKNSKPAKQTVALWRWTDGTWVVLDRRWVSTTQILIAGLAAPGSLSDYVSSGGDLRVRVRAKRTTSFVMRGDLLRVNLEVPGPTP